MFQDTLPPFLRDFSPRNQIVIHVNADPYSSTLYVLSILNQILVPGVIVLFDDFASFDNQFRAFGDFSSAFRRGYRILGAVAITTTKSQFNFEIRTDLFSARL